MSASQAPRTYAVCVYCKLRRVDRSVFYVDPWFPAAGLNYRCLDLDACGERRRAREVKAAERRQAKRQAAELAEAERQAEALAALAETEARLTAEAAEYVALIDHLCAPVADGGHGLVRESVQIVAYDTPQARSLHRIQEWRGGCGAVQIGQPETALRAMAPQISAVMDSAEPADTEPQQCDAETATWRSAPELLDMRFGPVDHACRGCWQHRGRNRGGHNVYRCDSGRHVLIDAHTVASHICNPVACEQPTEWALQP